MPLGEREDLGARRHDLAHDLLAELHDAGDDRDLLALADALELAFAQQILDGVALVGAAALAAARANERRASASGRATIGDGTIVDGAQHAAAATGATARRPATRDRARQELPERPRRAGERPATSPRRRRSPRAVDADEHAARRSSVSATPALAAVSRRCGRSRYARRRRAPRSCRSTQWRSQMRLTERTAMPPAVSHATTTSATMSGTLRASCVVLAPPTGAQPLEVHALDATPTHALDDDAESVDARSTRPARGTRPNSVVDQPADRRHVLDAEVVRRAARTARRATRGRTPRSASRPPARSAAPRRRTRRGSRRRSPRECPRS